MVSLLLLLLLLLLPSCRFCAAQRRVLGVARRDEASINSFVARMEGDAAARKEKQAAAKARAEAAKEENLSFKPTLR